MLHVVTFIIDTNWLQIHMHAPQDVGNLIQWQKIVQEMLTTTNKESKKVTKKERTLWVCYLYIS